MKLKTLLALLIITCSPFLKAQTNDPGTNKIVIDVVPNTTNPNETPAFYISRHAISPEQYCAFLNAVDTAEGRFYHQEWGDMMRKDWGLLTIAKSTTPPFHYTLINYDTYRITTELNPTTGYYHAVTNNIPKRTIMKGVPMADAARFCNWLAKGQPIGPIGNDTTETGSYTLFENRERQPNDSFYTKTIYDPKTPGGTRLKNAYMSVNRTPGATWRLPTQAELSMIFSPLSWGALDSDPSLWYWTEDSYLMGQLEHARSIGTPINNLVDPYHTGIPYTQGYYRVKNGQPGGIADLQTRKFQEESVLDTGFCVVFSADAIPQSGFCVFIPPVITPGTPSSDSNSPTAPPALPPILPPSFVLPSIQ